MFDVFARSPFYRKEERGLGTIYRTVVRSAVVPAKAGTHADDPESVLLKESELLPGYRLLLLSMGPRLRGDDGQGFGLNPGSC